MGRCSPSMVDSELRGTGTLMEEQFIGNRAEVAEGRVQPTTVVECLDVVEEVRPGGRRDGLGAHVASRSRSAPRGRGDWLPEG